MNAPVLRRARAEANTFLRLPTSYQAFVEKLYFRPGQYPERAMHQTGAMDTVRVRRTRRIRTSASIGAAKSWW